VNFLPSQSDTIVGVGRLLAPSIVMRDNNSCLAHADDHRDDVYRMNGEDVVLYDTRTYVASRDHPSFPSERPAFMSCLSDVTVLY